jgi:hypothetical protein
VTIYRYGELARGALAILAESEGGLRLSDILKRLEREVPPTPDEAVDWPRYPGQRRYEKYVRFSTIDSVKAGWLIKRRGIWEITEDGRRALDQYPDPHAFQREAARRYRAWRAARDREDRAQQFELGPWVTEDDDASESEDDLPVGAKDFARGAVLSSTDWTAETILSQLRRGNIDLNPSFQRRDAWKTAERKSRFIESVVLGLPIPQIVLAELKDRRGTYVVIDGKQRLLSLRQFAADDNDDFDPLVLAGLEIRPDLNGFTLETLREDSRRADDLAAFENQTIRTVVVREWPNEDFLYRVFLRLNTGSVPLSPQELRQALHPGPFMDFADEFSQASDTIHDALGVAQPDFRMRDVELLVRFIAFDRYLDSYAGNLKQFLDNACAALNIAWGDHADEVEEAADRCEAAIAATTAVFGRNAFRRWTGERWERTFNRAVFDAQTFYFKDPIVAAESATESEAVVDAFQALTVTNPKFAEALQTSTKTIGATYLRLAAWGGALGGVVGRPLPIPRMDENHIRYA